MLLLSLGVAIVLGIEARAFLEVPTLGRAYAVLSFTDKSRPGMGINYAFSYHWMANGDVAYLRKNPDGKFQVCYQPMSSTGPTGAVRPGPEVRVASSGEQFYPSPDEQWVAYTQTDAKYRRRTVLLSADGKTVRPIGKVGESFSSWLPDSRSFLSLCLQPRLGIKVTHLDTPQSEMIPGLNPMEIPQPMFDFPTGTDFQVGRYFNNSQSNAGQSGNAPTITVRSFNTAKPDVVQKTWTVPVPPGCQDAGAYVSPDRKHLLWITGTMTPACVLLLVQWRFWHTQSEPYLRIPLLSQ